MQDFIYLASMSPRRSELLKQLHITHQLLRPDESENAEALEKVLDADTPLSYVNRVTLLKLAQAQLRLSRKQLAIAPILCADTTVTINGTILGKPKNVHDAYAMLSALSGKTHQVLTSIALSNENGGVLQECSTSYVTFMPLSHQQMLDYIKTNEPFDKAGSYAIQGEAAAFITTISGSYSGIMGLPLFEVASLLRAINFSS